MTQRAVVVECLPGVSQHSRRLEGGAAFLIEFMQRAAVTRAAGIHTALEGGSMIRLRFAGIVLVVCALMSIPVVHAQSKDSGIKTMPTKQAVKPVDINSASEEEIAATGIDRPVAKKIVQGRPYRNKLELVSRQILTRDQYDKLKSSLVAKQPPKPQGK